METEHERDDPNFITREEIAKSQARNGWEALRRSAVLLYGADAGGGAIVVKTGRGR